MGALCPAGEPAENDQTYKPNPNLNSNRREYQVSPGERVILKMNIQKDRLASRIREMVDKQAVADAEVKQLLKAGNKDAAKFKLNQKKMISEQQKNYRQKETFIDEQIFKIKHAEEDVEFTNILSDSNKVLQDLMSKIDTEEVQTAKMLQEEYKMVREEMNEQLKDDEDDEMDEELQRLEADILGSGLNINVSTNKTANVKSNSQKQAQYA